MLYPECGRRILYSFKSPQEAMEFILRIPTIAAYGGYDPKKMSDEEIMEFANEILRQLQLVSYFQRCRGKCYAPMNWAMRSCMRIRSIILILPAGIS